MKCKFKSGAKYEGLDELTKDCCNQENCCEECGYEDCHEGCDLFENQGTCIGCEFAVN